MTNTSLRASIFYIDFLRFIAVIAVIIIHVLGPFRFLYLQIPNADWLAAMGYNSMTRWAVPLFIMLSGALLLSSSKPFNAHYYLKNRLLKVVVPFLGWTLIYALVSAFMSTGSFVENATSLIMNAPKEPTWYHLWFFYDFIPLYFVIPFLAPILKKLTPEHIQLLVVVFFLLFLMHFLKVQSFLQQNLILYSGYLILGWYLFNRDNCPQLKYWLIAGLTMLLLNFFGSWFLAMENGAYSSFFMGYKSLNTLLISAMLFVLAQSYADKITGKMRAFIKIISKYSLGIYLIHPLLLIPVRELTNGVYAIFPNNWIAIPVITFCVLLLSLCCIILCSKIPFVRRLVP
ncbi:hypothetical protein PCNPT3_09470 [Psychromonas sp. CNPT3]|uniref:acyltransferase n=1 Tax=Psychromonas sp. CNPT3 TaxID=314282 RepID=UPI0002C10ED3|nr:acyltransferase family protein [Psychromonas sp. CNPT3]AGH81832.1 hypothetical protein PCNPT3_09470 [Psychromonas sp. CNPT3]